MATLYGRGVPRPLWILHRTENTKTDIDQCTPYSPMTNKKQRSCEQ